MITKIIHIAMGKGNPNRPNGVNKVVNNMATYQKKNGLNVQLWGISFSKKHNYPKRNYKTKLFKDYKIRFKIDPLLKKSIYKYKNQDVVFHMHGGFIPQFYCIAKLLQKLNIPYVFTPHGAYNTIALKRNFTFKNIYIKAFEQTLVNKAQGIHLIGASETIGTQQYFNSKIFLIPNGQTLPKITQQPKQNNKLSLGFLGRIDIHTKGLDRLLSAIAKINKTHPVELHIIGSGGEMQALKQLIKKEQLENTVILRGALFGDDKFNALQQLDILCLTSRNEGMPGVVLEAASVKTPAIISKETNLGDYINKYKSGWVLTKNTTEHIYDTILETIEIKEKNQLNTYGEAAYKMVSKAFDWNQIVEQLNNMYVSAKAS